ncbi:MAG: hypothetical protein ACRCYY_17540 [Trueperaceae bacterium]
MEQRSLELSSSYAPPPNTLLQQGSSHLCILFPGLGYSAHMPLLYYSTNVFLVKGADVLQLHYDYKTEAFQSLSQEAQYRHITHDAQIAYQTVMKQHAYQKVTLLGKSLGTLVSLGSFAGNTARTEWVKGCLANTTFEK